MAARKTSSTNDNKKDLSPEQRKELLGALKARFERNMNRHKGLEWAQIQTKLEANAEKLWSLNEMEKTGGEPDVVGQDKKRGEYIFCDCSGESPKAMVRNLTMWLGDFAARWGSKFAFGHIKQSLPCTGTEEGDA